MVACQSEEEEEAKPQLEQDNKTSHESNRMGRGPCFIISTGDVSETGTEEEAEEETKTREQAQPQELDHYGMFEAPKIDIKVKRKRRRDAATKDGPTRNGPK